MRNIKKLSCLARRNFSLTFKSAVADLPHREKIHKGGEDANYRGDKLLVVADGVGGWSEVGVDPALYSKELCGNIKSCYEKQISKGIFVPKDILVHAAQHTKSQGSCTVCFGLLDEEKNYLYTVNLGDSGFLLLRKVGSGFETVFRSTEQQYQFNFPYQVGTEGTDPQLAQTHIFEVQPSDLVIFGTDGLWDNLYDKDILNIVQPFSDSMDVESVAKVLGNAAQRLSLEQTYMSPFARNSRNRYIGGKEDDITIVVGEIIKV